MPVLALFGLSLLWGSTFYFTKMLLPDFHPVAIVFYRCLFGGIILFPFFLWKKTKKDFEKIPSLILITLLSAGIPWVFMSLSLRGLDTTIGAVLNATGPIFGLIYSIVLLKLRVTKQELVSVFLGFSGILLSFIMGFSSEVGFRLTSAGLLLFAVSLYALSAVLAGKFLNHVSVFTLSFTTMLVGSAFSGIMMLWFDPLSFQSMDNFKNIGWFIMLGMFNSGLGNVLYFYLVKSGGAIFALLITYLMPITTILLGVLLLDESLGFGTIVALIFVLTSVYFTQKKGGSKMDKFQNVVAKLMKNNFSVDKSVTILVLTDSSTEKLGRKFRSALEKEGWNTDIYLMEDRTKSGEEPPAESAEEMLNYNLVFCLTKHSLTHTVARKKANANGVSVITMPGITEDMFLNGAMSADYRIVEKETNEMTDKLTKAMKVRISTGDGYMLTIPIESREGIPSTGVFHDRAASGNLPSGEAYIAPIESKSEGKIEISGSIAGIGLVDEPVILTIEQGRLIDATGVMGEKLLSILGDGDGRLLCELGIGTNHAARLTGNILEDEKAYNTIHIAFGSNHTFGGNIKTDVHIDCVTKEPIVEWEY
ncbi:aminopeptidase [Virgibacillus necropolis]|uniref:aminopeptidase n=1 Tax=Virgibacillus necropolis TaxID=163877 RepID=UPI00384F43E4